MKFMLAPYLSFGLELFLGVTGYESFEFESDINKRIKEGGWSACAGTKDRWDSLFIPADQMKIALDEMEELYQKELNKR